MKVRPPRNNLKFANETYFSVGSVQLRLYRLPGIPKLIVTYEIVAADVSALLGLDVLDVHQLTVDTVFS